MGKRWLGGLVCGVLGLYAPTAWGCGGGGIATREAGVVVDAQRVIISTRSSGVTDIVAQVTVPRTTADYGLLIPVPSEPTLDSEPIDVEDLESLDLSTAPTIVVEERSSGGRYCTAGGLDSAPPNRGLTVGSVVEIGPVEAVSLTGNEPEDVETWLDENGFVLGEEGKSVLERYVRPGAYFIAVRRSKKAPSDGPSSLGIHYSLAGNHRMLTLGFARIGAAEKVAFTVFVAGPSAVGPSAPFVPLTVDDLDAGILRHVSYEAAVTEAVAERGSKAFVLESKTRARSLRGNVPGLTRLFDEDAIITRATTIIDREELELDAYFTKPFEQDLPTHRYVFGVRHPMQLWGTSMGVMMGAAVGWTLRRRRGGVTRRAVLAGAGKGRIEGQ